MPGDQLGLQGGRKAVNPTPATVCHHTSSTQSSFHRKPFPFYIPYVKKPYSAGGSSFWVVSVEMKVFNSSFLRKHEVRNLQEM